MGAVDRPTHHIAAAVLVVAYALLWQPTAPPPASSSITFAVSPVTPANFSGPLLRDTTTAIDQLPEYVDAGCQRVHQQSPLAMPFVASTMGFLDGISKAYAQHLHLVLRPDDIWLALTSQFGLYVDGKIELEIETAGTVHTVDFGVCATQLVDEMRAHLVDPALADVLLPNFTTTTPHDRITASILTMATMKNFFQYKIKLSCGIPTVTLLGSVDDWQQIRSRIEHFRAYGERMQTWVDLLSGVLDQFVAAARGEPDTAFWRSIYDSTYQGCGQRYVSGWVSVFAVFDGKGRWQGDERTTSSGERSTYPIIAVYDLPPGYAAVDVEIDDNGNKVDAIMLAGHMSYAIQDNNTVVPQLGWAMALKPTALEISTRV
ncbi:hypothetical protein SPRG_12788 [Saprolegnia parasitica CBS 223.65]|uniref:DUF4419 domain-containing protein n=1 Tax=Saprolegnia parasitica (strain CBS 223.65) TaxID=695850 RepID=A0A067C699_SAPPC|nr:hypothetical protein SPRG_12788 [Saprolegnia parasitica CBS 223.65]KDO22327.1 hypothetical protein SPRG_12788 [Saprolegnia parasitica CBS 223.65]|eukprot:XP_012206961.1 hypothetical protein SPRG_12788 [Saprolegnia parasitica CBS 223.65]